MNTAYTDTKVVQQITQSKRSVHDNKALFEDVRKKWQVTVFISEVSNYTGLQITALAVYILKRISTNENKQLILQMFSFAISLQDDLKCTGLH